MSERSHPVFCVLRPSADRSYDAAGRFDTIYGYVQDQHEDGKRVCIPRIVHYSVTCSGRQDTAAADNVGKALAGQSLHSRTSAFTEPTTCKSA